MKNFYMMIVLLLMSVSTASAQAAEATAEATVDASGPAPIVKVWHPSFATMCRGLAEKLEAPVGTEMIYLRPKSMPPSRARNLGDTWEVSLRSEKLEVSATELPPALRSIRGSAAQAIFRGTCRLKDNYFYSTEDLVFITSNQADAELLRNSIR